MLLVCRVLETELREVKKYEKTLTELNRGPARDDLKEIIKAVVRAFDVDPEDLDFPQISNPAGFSGTCIGRPPAPSHCRP